MSQVSDAANAVPVTGGIFLPDTPNSLVERGHVDRGQAVLRRVRGTPDVDEEFSSILIANKAAQHSENPWRAIGRWALPLLLRKTMWSVPQVGVAVHEFPILQALFPAGVWFLMRCDPCLMQRAQWHCRVML